MPAKGPSVPQSIGELLLKGVRAELGLGRYKLRALVRKSIEIEGKIVSFESRRRQLQRILRPPRNAQHDNPRITIRDGTALTLARAVEALGGQLSYSVRRWRAMQALGKRGSRTPTSVSQAHRKAYREKLRILIGGVLGDPQSLVAWPAEVSSTDLLPEPEDEEYRELLDQLARQLEQYELRQQRVRDNHRRHWKAFVSWFEQGGPLYRGALTLTQR